MVVVLDGRVGLAAAITLKLYHIREYCQSKWHFAVADFDALSPPPPGVESRGGGSLFDAMIPDPHPGAGYAVSLPPRKGKRKGRRFSRHHCFR